MAGLVDRIGAHLRMVRRRADLSQRELAERSGVPLSTIARIEAGTTRDPRLSTLSRLVDAAGFRPTSTRARSATTWTGGAACVGNGIQARIGKPEADEGYSAATPSSPR